MAKYACEIIETRSKHITVICSGSDPYEHVRALYEAREIDMDTNLERVDLDIYLEPLASDEWTGYVAYLEAWARTHTNIKHFGDSPLSFDDWCDKEYSEKEE